MGLDGLLRARAHAVSGILNGIDEAVTLARSASRGPLRRADLDRRGGQQSRPAGLLGLLLDPDALLFGVVSRLSWQKASTSCREGSAGPPRRERTYAPLRLGRAELVRVRTAAAAHPTAAVHYPDRADGSLVQGGSTRSWSSAVRAPD